MNSLTHFETYDHSNRMLLILAISAGITLIVYLINKYFYEENEIYTYIKPGNEENKIIKIKGEEIHNIIDDFLDKKISEENFQEEQKKLQQEIDEKEKQDMEANDNKIKKDIYSFEMISFIGISLFTIWNIINNLISNIENIFNIISINVIFDIISLGAVSFVTHKEENLKKDSLLYLIFICSPVYMFVNGIILAIENSNESSFSIIFNLSLLGVFIFEFIGFFIIYFLAKICKNFLFMHNNK